MKSKMSKEEQGGAKSATKNAAEISKERLTRITKTRKHHLRTTGRVIKYGTKSFVRNTWLSVAAIAIMVITLVILAATFIATNVMGETISKVEAQVDMSIYIKQGATSEQVENIANRMRKLSTVTGVTYTSPEDANNASIKALIEENHITDEDYIKSLYEAPNKIPWTINVKLKNLDDTSELENFVNNDDSMKDMLDARPPSYSSSHRETIDRIASIMNRVQVIGLAAAGIFALVAILVVFNTIRMAIFNRKEEIYMMKLVGASRGFIAGPFVVEASLYGIVSAAVAYGIIYIAMYFLGTRMDTTFGSTYALLQQYWYFIVAALLVIGILIGVISALLATRKYLKIK